MKYLSDLVQGALLFIWMDAKILHGEKSEE